MEPPGRYEIRPGVFLLVRRMRLSTGGDELRYQAAGATPRPSNRVLPFRSRPAGESARDPPTGSR
jgi:hypothetical protein